jgi:hypothetical protein
MDVIKLRKLAHKSVWDYGKYKGYIVKDIIIMNKRYLLWAYYALEKISFIDEILDDLEKSYKNFKRIDKPGKDLDYYENNLASFDYAKLSKQQLLNLLTANRMNGKKHNPALLNAYRNAKSKYIHANRIEVESKSSLQALNHGNTHEIEVRVLKKNK